MQEAIPKSTNHRKSLEGVGGGAEIRQHRKDNVQKDNLQLRRHFHPEKPVFLLVEYKTILYTNYLKICGGPQSITH